MPDIENVAKYEDQIHEALRCYTAHAPANDLDRVTDDFVHALAIDNATAKRGLRDLFRRSPVWNEELDALVINGTRTHDPDRNAIVSYARMILRNRVPHFDIDDLDIQAPYVIRDAFLYCCVDDRPNDPLYCAPDGTIMTAQECLEKIAPGAYVPGKKPSRVFKSICDALGITDNTAGSEFQRYYAMLADELNAKQIDFKLFVTPGPGYFLTMSNPKCDRRGSTLTSCHSLNSSDYTYNSGCSGYARDEVSFLVFTVANPNDHETLFNRKTTRQVFAYRPGGGVLLQSRLYNTSGGTSGAQAESQVYRDLIQREISALENVPNLWKTSDSYKSDLVDEGTAFGGYPDWEYEDFAGKVSVRADAGDHPAALVVGAAGLCLYCGCETGGDNGLFCEDCSPRSLCYVCDESYPDDDLYTVYDSRGIERVVCLSCRENYYTRCAECGEYHDDNRVTWVSAVQEYVCLSCLNEHYTCCDDCGEYIRSEDVTYVRETDEYICPHCLEKDFIQCDQCGEYYPADDIHKFDDSYMCPSCFEDLTTICEECGCIVWKDNTQDCGGKTVCDDCAERICPIENAKEEIA